MSLNSLLASTVTIDVIRSRFNTFKDKGTGENVSYYEIVGLIGEDIIAINTLNSSAELVKFGDTVTVEVSPTGQWANVKVPKFRVPSTASFSPAA